MKLYAFRSKALWPMWEQYFAPSVPKSFELIPIDVPAQYDGCNYGEPRFFALMKWIVGQRVKVIKENLGGQIASSGCDSFFVGDPVPDFQERLKRVNFIAANDASEPRQRLCACLQALNCNLHTLEFQYAIWHCAGSGSDDTIMNNLRGMVSCECLPRRWYWNIADLGRPWQPGQPRPLVPRGVLWIHGNYTVGLANKMTLLAELKKEASA